MNDILATFLQQSPDELRRFITTRKAELGDSLVILAHHYQRPAVVEIADLLGDSFKLCRLAAEQDAKHVLFCGVDFMAEAADILTPDTTAVQLSEARATCPMAAMAQIDEVRHALDTIATIKGHVPLPIVYMNSDSEIKALCGEHGGSVCTSSNAEKVMNWGFTQRKSVMFFPDENLGRNTAKTGNYAPGEIALWDRRLYNGGLSEDDIDHAKLFLWSGNCHVHVSMLPIHVAAARHVAPEGKIVVHPECFQEVADAADAVGSTEFIIDYVNQQPPGTTIHIGTEVNLVERLATQITDKTIKPLAPGALCYNMAKTNLAHVAASITEENLGVRGIIHVDKTVAANAKLALMRMLEVV